MIGQGNTQPATEEEKSQAQSMLASIEDYLSDESNVQGVIAEIQKGQDDPASAIGAIAGQLVHMNVYAATSKGVTISRDILLAIAAEVINAMIEIAMSAGIVSIQDEQQLQQLQGDALISAVDAYMSLGDPEVNGQAAQQVMDKAVSGQMDSQEAQQGMINNMVGGMA